MLALSATLALGLAATAAAADSVTFRFDWPDALVAQVEATRTRTGPGRAPIANTLRGRLEAEVRGAERRVGFRDWRLVGPETAAGLDPLVAAVGRITTVTTRSGAFTRVEGIEPALETMRALWRDARPEARPTLERLEQLAPAMLTKEASELWAMLVELWDGKVLDVGDEYEIESRVPVAVLPGEAVRVVARVRVERRLACPGGGSCVEARMRSEPDGKDLERMAKRLFAELKLPAQVSAMLGELSAVTEIVLVTEPARLVPHRLEKVRTMRSARSAGSPAEAAAGERRDATVYTFTYAAAASRGKR